MAVPTLSQKWKRVCKELPPAAAAFANLSNAADAADIALWTADAEAAQAARANNVEAMDIYDVHKKPCESLDLFTIHTATKDGSVPTQNDIHIDLVDEELQDAELGGSAGEATWLSAGLKLEARKWVLLIRLR